jgi:hypothetical protein
VGQEFTLGANILLAAIFLQANDIALSNARSLKTIAYTGAANRVLRKLSGEERVKESATRTRALSRVFPGLALEL